jgi:hypothetical protein
VVSSAWSRLERLRPALVGGCRPLALAPLLSPERWTVRHRAVIERLGIPSEVLVAERLA